MGDGASLKIAQVNVYFKPFMVGGAEWYVYNISTELVKVGHEVHVFTADRCNGERAPSTEVIDGINVHRLPLKIDLTYRTKVWDGLYDALSAGSFDVIHTYDYAQPHSVDAIRAGRRAGKCTVLTVFDVHSMIPRVWYKQLPMKLVEGYMARRTLPGADRILVRAPNLVQPIIELGGAAERILVTPSGIRDASLGNFDGALFRDRYKVEGSPMVLYLGRLNPLKGPQDLLAAAPAILKAHPEASFVLVGPDQSGYAKTLAAEANSLGIGQHVHLVGPIFDFDEKMQAYAACQVFVLPTAYEGTSQAIFEAMSQGKPVVATRVGGVPYQVSDGEEGYLVEHGDVKMLATRINELLDDPSLAAEMGRKGRERVRSNRYSVLATALSEIYGQAGTNN
jgi:glycosyltransferase involved in cell wall biosynthesis